MSSTPATFRQGVTNLDDMDLAVYLAFGVLANALVLAGLPKAGGMLAAMVLATYLAGISDAAAEGERA